MFVWNFPVITNDHKKHSCLIMMQKYIEIIRRKFYLNINTQLLSSHVLI